jgi:hypothetical protein
MLSYVVLYGIIILVGMTNPHKRGKILMKNEKINVIMFRVGRTAQVIEIKNSLENLQRLVDGYIEVVYLNSKVKGNENLIIICNEEGKFNKSPNRAIGNDIIFGDFIICSTKGENFTGLSDKQIDNWNKLENFIR